MHKEELLAMGYDALLAMAGELGIKNLRKFKNNEDSIKELVFAIIDQQAMAKASQPSEPQPKKERKARVKKEASAAPLAPEAVSEAAEPKKQKRTKKKGPATKQEETKAAQTQQSTSELSWRLATMHSSQRLTSLQSRTSVRLLTMLPSLLTSERTWQSATSILTSH